MKNRKWMPAMLGAVVLSIAAVSNGCSAASGVCCTDFKPGTDMANIDVGLSGGVKGQFTAFAQASGDLIAAVGALNTDVLNACKGIAVDLGADPTEPDAAKLGGKEPVEYWCNLGRRDAHVRLPGAAVQRRHPGERQLQRALRRQRQMRRQRHAPGVHGRHARSRLQRHMRRANARRCLRLRRRLHGQVRWHVRGHERLGHVQRQMRRHVLRCASDGRNVQWHVQRKMHLFRSDGGLYGDMPRQMRREMHCGRHGRIGQMLGQMRRDGDAARVQRRQARGHVYGRRQLQRAVRRQRSSEGVV